ncbi:hypothetical protein BG015_008755 [Linnemannia schmuckeri]|uniref:Uncharacterized protein n=1 Tax=Linnemannia schmuckeri TaxID=64567 RepID=A0A9P5RZ06_9FUNG|nr:hypothetical protein BG015_008755 [Linnemannia schmuckeri]
METHPLSLPEIVLIVGKHIPLWVPREQRYDVVVWLFQPKDLVAALSVNRLFYTILTPLLWNACAYPYDRSQKYLSSSYRGNLCRFRDVAAEVFTKNSIHIRYLDLSRYEPHDLHSLNQLQLACTRLRELRLSHGVDATNAGQLIRANPGLQLVRWKRYIKFLNEPEDLRVLFPLRQLRYLGLKGWAINPVYLHHILHNNADTLEEVELGEWSIVLRTPHMNEQWNGLDPSSLDSLTDEEQAEAVDLIKGQSLLLPKVKTLHLLVKWSDTSRSTVCNLVRSFPALETLKIGFVDNELGMRLGNNLKEICPKLNSILNMMPAFDSGRVPLPGYDGISYVVGACVPGNLVHIELNRWEFDAKLADALVEHRNGLEILDVSLSDYHHIVQSFDNVSKVLARCTRLREFSMYNDSRLCKEQHASILLNGLKECRTLEWLTLVGFPFAGPDESDNEANDEEEGELDAELGVPGNTIPTPTPQRSFELWPGWSRGENKNRGDLVAPRDTLKIMVFEAVGTLPSIKTVDLNNQRFEKMSSI